MAKKIRQTAEQIDKQTKITETQDQVQELINTKPTWYMSELRETWNKKNQLKIQELIKLNDRMICRFNNFDISVKVSNMILG